MMSASSHTGSLIRFNNTYRDAIQSLLGTNPSAKEIIDSHPNAHKMGFSSIQTCGGTFFDVVARKGRLPGPFVQEINAAYPGIEKTMLFRGDCGLHYDRKSYDAIKMLVREHAKAGVNVFQNFHGLNDTRMQVAVARAVQEVRAETGLDIRAQGTICIEDNANITIESCLQAARELVKSGHQGFYLKSASGCLKPGFVKKLVGALMDEFPDQSVDVHVHNTYGEALPAYMEAIEAAVARRKGVGLDVLHPSIADNTAQPSVTRLYDLIQNHPDPAVRANAPALDMDALDADRDTLLALRQNYREFETRYNPALLAAMREARAAGGASATLKSIPGLEQNLAAVLGTNDWERIQIAVYKMQAKILSRLGDHSGYALCADDNHRGGHCRAAQ
jgi:pyruvate carboxylase